VDTGGVIKPLLIFNTQLAGVGIFGHVARNFDNKKGVTICTAIRVHAVNNYRVATYSRARVSLTRNPLAAGPMWEGDRPHGDRGGRAAGRFYGPPLFPTRQKRNGKAL
jgi:hypothetical protein